MQTGDNNGEATYSFLYHMRNSYLQQKRQRKQAGHKQSQDREVEAHLTVAIRRQDYSIALTKCFQNTVKLRERRNRGGG